MFRVLFLLAQLFVVKTVFALSGHGYVLLSETIETSPMAKGRFAELPADAHKGYVFAWAKANDSMGKAGENAVVSGYHSVSLANPTDKDQVYTYKYELSCDGQYFRKIDHVLVHPDGFASDKGFSYLSTYHKQPGLYQINAVTDVKGESNHNQVDVGALKIVR